MIDKYTKSIWSMNCSMHSYVYLDRYYTYLLQIDGNQIDVYDFKSHIDV